MELEDFLSKDESKFVALLPQHFCQNWISAVEDSDFTLALFPNLGENLVPIGSAGVRTGFQARDQISFFLQEIFFSLDLIIFRSIIVITFSWSKSRANCSPTAFMSVLCKADVMYMCISKKCPITPPCSDCSISNCDKSLTNHSNDFWSRLIQKKSTFFKLNILGKTSSLH